MSEEIYWGVLTLDNSVGNAPETIRLTEAELIMLDKAAHAASVRLYDEAHAHLLQDPERAERLRQTAFGYETLSNKLSTLMGGD